MGSSFSTYVHVVFDIFKIGGGVGSKSGTLSELLFVISTERGVVGTYL